jgi:hypothetical protein
MTGTNEESHDFSSHWHLDKRVPITILLAIAVQTGTWIWWASNASTRLDAVERKVEAAAPQAERIIRLDEKMSTVQQNLLKLESLPQSMMELKAIVTQQQQQQQHR